MLRAEEEIENMTVKKITPVLLVEDVEACVKFWMERLGFEKTAEVPEGNELGFVILRLWEGAPTGLHRRLISSGGISSSRC